MISPEPEPKPKRKSEQGETPNQIGWRCWKELYAAAYGAEYPTVGPCGKAMVDVTKTADRHAQNHPDHDPADLLGHRQRCELLLRHWFSCYLHDDGHKGFLAEERHPLRMVTRDVPRYGFPWGRNAQDTPLILIPPPAARPSPEIEARAAEIREMMRRGEPIPDVNEILRNSNKLPPECST